MRQSKPSETGTERTPLNAHIVILGLSSKTGRYSRRCAESLLKAGYENLSGVHPRETEVLGIPVNRRFSDIDSPIDTVTLYVGPDHLSSEMADVIAARPRRIIFNPGTENAEFRQKAEEMGIVTKEACTLVMLGNGTF